MTQTASLPGLRARVAIVGLALGVALTLAYGWPSAQTATKRALKIDDYATWRTIGAPEISSDGAWVTYGLSFTNTAPADAKPELHLLNLATSQDTRLPNASNGTFSADAKWIAYQVDPGAGGRGGRGNRAGGGAGGGTAPANAPAGGGAQNAAPQGQGGQAQGRGAATPAEPRRVELRNLATGEIRKWQDIQSFTFSSNSQFLLLRRRPAQVAGGAAGRAGGGADAPGTGAAPAGGGETAGPRGIDVTLHNIATGRDQFLGSVAESAFSRDGSLLAYTVDAATKDANGLFIVDLPTGRIIPLENDAKTYNRLTWNEDGTSLAVMKGSTVDKMRERENVLVVYPSVKAAMGDAPAAPVVFDPSKASNTPKGWVLSDRTGLSWSADNTRILFGMKAQVAEPDTNGQRRGTDEVANVDVWNSTDDRIQSMQMTRADTDRNFTYREAFDVSAKSLVLLTDETMRDIDVAAEGPWAVGRDARAYVSDYKPPAADFYRVDVKTGARTLMFKNQLTSQSTFGFSPDGKVYLYWKDGKYQAYDLAAGSSRTLGGNTTASFVNAEYDHPGPKPSYGVAGFTSDNKNLIAQQRYDLWVVPLDGSAARNLTNGAGAKGEVRFRYVRTEPADAGGPGPGGAPGGGGGRGGGRGGRNTIDLAKPITLSAYGEYTKKAGFYELANGQLREIVYEDASFSTPQRAAKADTYLFTRQTFVDFPDLRVSGPDFKNSKKITDANPQQSEYLWGHRILFDFKDKLGHRLQGILTLPDDYTPGEKRPMLVNFYEDNSQNLHRYSAPSYLSGMGSMPIQATTEGYVTMIPDVHYHTGASHSDQLDSVEAAVKKVIEMGYVDPKKIGLNGHSYGGEGAAFIATRSRLFAAVAEGAGVVDLYNDFNMNWGWSYQVPGGNGGGANGTNYYLYDQGREGVSPWDNPEMYRFESALTHVPEVTQPILIMQGTADPTVGFINSLAFYNALRYNNKNAILLAYQNEGHGLRGLANRKDLTIRYFQFFNHYLKGEPAPKWMTDGVPFLQKDANQIIK